MEGWQSKFSGEHTAAYSTPEPREEPSQAGQGEGPPDLLPEGAAEASGAPSLAAERPGAGGSPPRPGNRPTEPPVASVRPSGRLSAGKESPLEELTRLLGSSIVAEREGALVSSQALMKIAADTASTRLKESEALSRKLLTESEAIAKRQVAESEAIAKRQLTESEAIAKRQLTESEAIAKRQLAETQAITQKQLADCKEAVKKLEEAAAESIRKREAELATEAKDLRAWDQKLREREAELTRREQELQEKVMGEHLALLDLRKKGEEEVRAELKPLRDAMAQDYAQHQAQVREQRKILQEQLTAEWKAGQERLAAEAQVQKEQLAAERKAHREQLELILSQAKEFAQERAEYSKKLVDNVDLGAGALLKIADTVQKQADLVAQMGELSAGPPAPKTSGAEVMGNVAMSFFDAIKNLGMAAIQHNPKLAKSLEGPLVKGAELAKLGEQAAAEAGFVPSKDGKAAAAASEAKTSAASTAEAAASLGRDEESALKLPLAILNKPEVLQQLRQKYGPDYLTSVSLGEFVEAAQKQQSHGS